MYSYSEYIGLYVFDDESHRAGVAQLYASVTE